MKVEPFAAALLPRCRERCCAHCFCSIEAGHRKKCGGCGHVLYCGPACQKKDWKSHHRRECDGGPALSAALNNDETAVSDAEGPRAPRRSDSSCSTALPCVPGSRGISPIARYEQPQLFHHMRPTKHLMLRTCDRPAFRSHDCRSGTCCVRGCALFASISMRYTQKRAKNPAQYAMAC